MDQNVDEDLIEATIRRVAEAQAARASVAQDIAGAPAGAEREAAPTDEPELEAWPEVEPGAPETPEDDPEPQFAPARAADESAIEETIRRVAAARAEREAEEAPEASSVAATAAEAPLPFVPRGGHVAAAALQSDADDDGDRWAQSIGRIEATLGEVHAMLRELLERPASGAPATRFTPPPKPANDEWEDDAPVVPKMAFTPPPRPSVLRDVSAAPRASVETATPDERPLPEPLPPVRPDQRRGLDLLPRTYRITVEDKRRGVDLVPLHRALLAMDGVRDMSLLSYNKGVAIVALETVNDIEPESLGRAVSRAMSREAAVETHNERTLVVKLAEE